MKRTAAWLSILFVIAPFVLGQAPANRVSRINFDELKWADPADEKDALGFKTVVLAGDPSKAGLYIVLVKFPPGVMSKPHFHPEDRHAMVVKGTWYTGEGDAFTPDKTVPLKPGSYMKHPGGVHHYDGARNEEVILQLTGIGPSKTTRINEKEGLFGYSIPPKK